jgi:hypothetical protein
MLPNPTIMVSRFSPPDRPLIKRTAGGPPAVESGGAAVHPAAKVDANAGLTVGRYEIGDRTISGEWVFLRSARL